MVCCAVAAMAAPVLLTGCNNFFVCQKASCPSTGSGTGTGTGSGDYAYVSNSKSGSTYLAAYDLSGGALTAISNSPYNLGFAPVALDVAPSNSFLYAATPPGVTSPGIYAYSIGSNGALTVINNGTVLANDAVASMDISPDGNYLFVLETTGLTLNEYQVNTSTGLLALVGPISLPNTSGASCVLQIATPVTQACTVKVSPSGQFVAVSLGVAGDVIFPYSGSSGITSGNYTLISPASRTSGDYSLAMDSSNNTYIARTDALTAFSVASNGTATQEGTATYTSGSVPRSVTLSNGYNYVYTANEGSSTISGYIIGTGGVLTAMSGSPFAAPTNVSALGVDNTGDYLVAAGYNGSSGVQLFSIGSTGALSSLVSTGSGTSTAYPTVLALTH